MKKGHLGPNLALARRQKRKGKQVSHPTPSLSLESPGDGGVIMGAQPFGDGKRNKHDVRTRQKSLPAAI